jgi:peptidoglycan/LPS O-acetylase OafA/YrhL
MPSPLAYWFSWSLGAYTADAFLQGRPLPLGKSSTTFWCFLVIVSYFLRLLAPFSFLLCALLTTRIISHCLPRASALPPSPGFWLRSLRRVGLYSYSIYLLHQPWLENLGRLLHQDFPLVWAFPVFLLCVSLSFVVMPLAGFCYHFIERPGITLGKQIIQKMINHKLLLPAWPAAISTGEKSED